MHTELSVNLTIKTVRFQQTLFTPCQGLQTRSLIFFGQAKCLRTSTKITILGEQYFQKARYLVSIASLTWALQGGIGREKYDNLSADKVCFWPVAPLGEAKWLWWFPWYRNNRQQPIASPGKGHYTNADIIIIPTPPTTEWNLDFVTRTTSEKSAKLFTRKLCHAIRPQNFAILCD